MAKHKFDKEAKATAVEQKCHLAATRKKEKKAMQQEKLVSTAKAKAAQEYARAEELLLKLKAAIKASTGCNDTTSPSLNTVHSHKKSKSLRGYQWQAQLSNRINICPHRGRILPSTKG
jgi:hypothetical protein